MTVSGVTTFLWFDTQGKQAADFYVSLFPDSRISSVSYYPDGVPGRGGTELVVEFELFGRPFAALNGGPEFPHSEAVSFQVACDTQAEIDRLWFALIADGGAESRCGWCKDRFGVSWQIVPRRMGELLAAHDAESSGRAYAAMMQMGRLDIAELERAGAV
jgi:predicted 3-demethylubiquinone-9 3-methyltransferase (glyoxalase superfamily)